MVPFRNCHYEQERGARAHVYVYSMCACAYVRAHPLRSMRLNSNSWRFAWWRHTPSRAMRTEGWPSTFGGCCYEWSRPRTKLKSSPAAAPGNLLMEGMDVDLDQELMQKFSCMGTTDKDVLISEFQRLLGFQLNPAGCAFFLDMTNWWDRGGTWA